MDTHVVSPTKFFFAEVSYIYHSYFYITDDDANLHVKINLGT